MKLSMTRCHPPQSTTLLAAALLCAMVSGNHAFAANQESGFYCDTAALTPQQRARQRVLGKALRDAVRASRETALGYEFEFPPATYGTLVEFIPLERDCCPFFEFTMRVSADGGPLLWTLGGRSGVKDFIREEFTWLLDRQ